MTSQDVGDCVVTTRLLQSRVKPSKPIFTLKQNKIKIKTKNYSYKKEPQTTKHWMQVEEGRKGPALCAPSLSKTSHPQAYRTFSS